ncbi:hypothetical protein [Limnoglobus roseus]|uniref:hypothetical protein n=1 Tax=Limnoglobus roseus TaxID=2598579 RepID=UPI00143D3A8E|nr:hypothetical protein [Limnoglobus roseus]
MKFKGKRTPVEATCPPTCPDLSKVTTAWPDLPDYIRKAILAMIDAHQQTVAKAA